MEQLFLTILNRAVTAGWLVLLVMVLRVVLKKAPRAAHYGLWAIVAVRLLWPGDLLPRAGVSLVPTTEPISGDVLTAAGTAVSGGLPAVGSPAGAAAAETAAPTVECTKFKVTGADDMTFFSRGETAEIVYVVEPAEAKSAIVWESSDDTIATVNEYGVISARRGGNCTITGTCGDQSVSVNVICDFTVPTSVLDMNYEDITMDHEGQTVQLSIDYELTDDQIAATVWESSDEAVATVDKNGLITAVADGTAVVTASIGDYTASCIVRCVKVTGNKGVNSEDSPYVINYQDVTLSRKGEYFQLTLKTITGEEMPEYAWTSSDNSVATVDSKGIVTAVANGTCKITTSVGGDDFECIVRVSIAS